MKKSIIIIWIIILGGCQNKNVQFDGAAAYTKLVQQCDFGPRNPGSEGYKNCKEFLIHSLAELADTVFTQKFEHTVLKDGNSYDLTNIVARFNSVSEKHILLGAHWDTRPWADMDQNPLNREKPIIGANDGASGVAVLLELAKMFNATPPPVNVTMVLFDGEDLGIPALPNSYAIGSQHFSQNLPISKPDFGIIIDMIGDRNLEIPIERNSYRVAPQLIEDLWKLAEKLKLSGFQNKLGFEIYDDHVPLWEIAGIPTIDLIDLTYPNQRTNFWHTLQDLPENCSAESLAQVGQLLATYIYNLEQ